MENFILTGDMEIGTFFFAKTRRGEGEDLPTHGNFCGSCFAAARRRRQQVQQQQPEQLLFSRNQQVQFPGMEWRFACPLGFRV